MKPNYEAILKRHKLSLTAGRLAVLEILQAYPHSEARHIYDLVKSRIATTSKQAIYNNLNALIECGIVREIKPKGRASLYETRAGDNHHHLVCRQCQRIVDTNCLDVAPCLTLTDAHGFSVDEAEIIFWGTCPSCQKTKPPKGE